MGKISMKNITKIISLAIALSVPFLCSSTYAKNRTFTYQNPIKCEPLRDPFIVKVGKTYYLTATSKLARTFKPFGISDAPSAGVKLWSSKDLKNWHFEKLILEPTPGKWYQRRFWAPEIFIKDKKYYLTVNCEYPEPKTNQGVCLAVADNILGPYKVLTPDSPLIFGNDASIFEDEDGKTYLFRSNIDCMEIDLDHAKIVGKLWSCITPGTKDDWDGGRGVGLEAPECIKEKGVYYLFFSSWGRGYEVGVATATNIRGPWTKCANNPIYGAQDRDWCKRYGKVYTQSPDIPFCQVGHGAPFKGPDGRWWLSSHGIIPGEEPQLVIDPINIKDGTASIKLTWTPQTIKLK